MSASSGQQPPAEVAQPSWLNDQVRIGGDRAIIGPTNWAALSHQQLYDAVCGNNDPGVVFDVSDRWVNLGNTMLESVNTLHQQVANTTSGWEGDAAESSRNAVIQLVDWGGKASQTAQFMGHQLNQQAQVMATAKANMPQPQQFDLTQATAVAPGMAGLRSSLTDMQVAAQAADEAHARAVDVARAMESASIPIDSATPEFEPVPTVQKKGVVTPGTTLLPADGPTLRTGTTDGSTARQQQDGIVPAQPGPATPNEQRGMSSDGVAAQSFTPAGLSAPGTAGSGYTAQYTAPAGVQPGGGQAVAGGQSGSWQPGTTTSTSWYTPGPAATPGIGSGGFVPPVGAGPSPVNTTPSGYPGLGPWVVPQSSDDPQPTPGGSGAPAWTEGDPESMGGPGGTPFQSADGGIGPISPGVAGGVGVGSAAGEEGYRPGTISARLGGSSGGAGSGSSALGPDEVERAGTRAGAAGGVAEPGSPGSGASGMSGARRGRKEDDKKHKSAGYVQGDDDIFEPLGGDLAPPVIGERRSKQPK